MHRLAFLAAFAVTAATASAQTPLSAEDFDRLTQGRTLMFFSEGEAYGAERYKPGRRVVWTFLDGKCKDGHWYQQGEFICFVYEGVATPQCWTFFANGAGLSALFEGRQDGTELYEAGEADEEFICLGPDVGV
ncbi:hypothetical protein EU800_14145 [Tropicimonas sp. IMCC6043]|nr:hypothetical protein EU800_14145 [Tropicimonas sp. IMCC6043]